MDQKIPKPKRLQEWYKKMLDKAVAERIVHDYKVPLSVQTHPTWGGESVLETRPDECSSSPVWSSLNHVRYTAPGTEAIGFSGGHSKRLFISTVDVLLTAPHHF